MASLEMNRGAAVAGSSDNHAAKKRRRWSTVHDEPVAPNRFGGKKQLRILGRQHARSSSSNSLASFQSNSNPIFEPNAPSYSSNNSELVGEALRQSETRSFKSQWNNPPARAFLTTDGGRGGAEQPHPNATRLSSQKTRPGSSLRTNDGGVWGAEEDGVESPDPLRLSPTSYGGGAYWAANEARETSLNYGEEKWRLEEGANESERLPPESPPPLSSNDGAQSIDGPRYIDDVSQLEEEELESCERRSRELVEKIQANAAAELAQLKAYKATIDQLRAECIKHETAAKQPPDLHGDIVAQFERERRAEAMAKEELKQKLETVESELRDAKATAERDWKSKLGTMEEELNGWRKNVETLEMELISVKMDRDAVAIALSDERKKLKDEHHAASQGEEKEVSPKADAATMTTLAVDAQLNDDNEEIEAGPKVILASAAQAHYSKKLFEVQAQLAAVYEGMDKLQRERNDMRIAVLDGKKKVEEAQKERDAVVLAVQSEWDAVKFELREGKEKLECELETVREQKVKLERELNAQTQKQNFDRHDSRKPEESDAVAIAVREENKKLEIELVEVRDHNSKLESEREALLAALVDVRDGNKKLEGELSDVRDKKIKLEREREALIAVREERQKLDAERALIVKAMRGENKKLESDREVLIAMQEYLKKLEMKQDLGYTVGGDEKRRRKCRQDSKSSELPTDVKNGKMLDIKREATVIRGR